MKKIHYFVIIISFIFLTSIAFFFTLRFRDEQLNDTYADKELSRLNFSKLPNNIKIDEPLIYIGCFEKRFTIRISFIAESDLKIDELNSQIHNIINFQNTIIAPYSNKKAGELGFTGIQKELEGKITDNYYIITIIKKPQSYFDRRNKCTVLYN